MLLRVHRPSETAQCRQGNNVNGKPGAVDLHMANRAAKSRMPNPNNVDGLKIRTFAIRLAQVCIRDGGFSFRRHRHLESDGPAQNSRVPTFCAAFPRQRTVMSVQSEGHQHARRGGGPEADSERLSP